MVTNGVSSYAYCMNRTVTNDFMSPVVRLELLSIWNGDRGSLAVFITPPALRFITKLTL
jgi:hypothetical protein